MPVPAPRPLNDPAFVSWAFAKIVVAQYCQSEASRADRARIERIESLFTEE